MDYYHQFQSLESYHLSATSRPESNFLKFKVIMVEVITPLHISAGKKESGKEKEDSEEESTREEELFKKSSWAICYSGEYNSWPHKVQRFHIFFCVSDK